MQSAVEGLCDIGVAISGYAEIISHNIVKKEVVDSLQTVARQRKITMTIDGGCRRKRRSAYSNAFTGWIKAIPEKPEAPAWDWPSLNTAPTFIRRW